MRGADYLIKVLKEHGVDTIFGYPGGAIMPVYDALVESGIKHILCRHEQAAVFAADGYSRSSSKLGVCLATSGPGATNLITGIANAYMDSIPLLAITGQVPSNLIGTDAFQEVDIFGLSMPVVKHSFLVTSIDELPNAIYQAIHIAKEGRPGPVLIDIAKDVQQETIQGITVEAPKAQMDISDKETIAKAVELISAAQKPLFYAGGGIELAQACDSFAQLVEHLQVPAVTTLKGIGAIPSDSSFNLGMLGMHGTKAANNAVQACDLLIAVGARFDDRATGNLEHFAPNAKVIHFDCDPAEINKLKEVELQITGELNHALQSIKDASAINNSKHYQAWLNHCQQNKTKFSFKYNHPGETIYAPALLNRLSDITKDKATIVTCDVGQHQMWVAQHMAFNHPAEHLSSGGLGAMGYGLPSAIGAQFANPSARVINVSGDGSIMMNIQELATLIRYQIPVKILLLDNQRLGMVRQWQHLFFENRFSEIDLSDNPDFSMVANAFGIHAKSISKADEVENALQEFIHNHESYLLHVSIDPDENVWPLVPPGKSNSEYIEESCS